jgi:hypothetical protein
MDPAPAVLPPPTADELFTLEYLQSHEAACPACGYNVHALQVPRCPECGNRLALRIVSTDRLSRSWVAAMVAASLAAGVGLLVLAAVLRSGWPRMGPPEQLKCNILLPFFLAMIPLPGALLLFRRVFGRRSAPFRRLSASLLVAVIALMVLWFLSTIAR